VYGVFERQFRRYYAGASHHRGLTGLNLLQTLESRLDNVVFRLGFTVNRETARVLVAHGHFTVNGHRTDVPSRVIVPGEVIAVRDESRGLTYFKGLREEAEQRTVPTWLDRDLKGLSGKVLRLPERAEIDGNLNEQLIVEYYSR
jgi:small subunit ribosomal protein S4